MEKSELRILAIENLSDSENNLPRNIFQAFGNLGFDLIFIDHSRKTTPKYQVEIWLLSTPNVSRRHDGQWRFILTLQGEKYEEQGEEFLYFNIPNINQEILISVLEKYFILEIQKS